MIHLSPETVDTLRERFVQDMNVCGFTDKTRYDYIRTALAFAAFLERLSGLIPPRPLSPALPPTAS